MRCEEFEQRLNVLIDEGRRGLWDGELWKHWESCSFCRQVADSYAAMLDCVQTLKTPEPASGLADRVLHELHAQPASTRRWPLAAALLATAAGLMLAIIPLVRATHKLAQVEPAPTGGDLAAAVTPGQMRSTKQMPLEQLPIVPQLVSMATTTNPKDLARGTGQGLATVFLYTPYLGPASINKVDAPWPAEVSESLRPVTEPLSTTVNLLRLAFPVVEVASRS